MIFLGIGFIILCLYLLRASNTDKTEIKSALLKALRVYMEDAFQAGYTAGYAQANGRLMVETCEEYIKRKMKEIDNECEAV